MDLVLMSSLFYYSHFQIVTIVATNSVWIPSVHASKDLCCPRRTIVLVAIAFPVVPTNSRAPEAKWAASVSNSNVMEWLNVRMALMSWIAQKNYATSVVPVNKERASSLYACKSIKFVMASQTVPEEATMKVNWLVTRMEP